MNIYQADYFEDKGVYYHEYKRIVVAQTEGNARKQLVDNEPHTNPDLWDIGRIWTDEETVINVWSNNQ